MYAEFIAPEQHRPASSLFLLHPNTARIARFRAHIIRFRPFHSNPFEHLIESRSAPATYKTQAEE
ncbi:hypothetical protein I541_4308 [Mycobacteroides abscessus]|nr:hypothetical protein I541_4308 [Mycobacteroides abscessus]